MCMQYVSFRVPSCNQQKTILASQVEKVFAKRYGIGHRISKETRELEEVCPEPCCRISPTKLHFCLAQTSQHAPVSTLMLNHYTVINHLEITYGHHYPHWNGSLWCLCFFASVASDSKFGTVVSDEQNLGHVLMP